MRVILTPEDLLKGEVVAEAGWYPLEVMSYEEKEAESDKSTNCIFNFRILDGPEKGKAANKLFNEKALGFGKGLWTIIVPGFAANPQTPLSTELFKSLVSKKVKGYIKRSKSNKGNEFNDITEFMPIGQVD